MVFRDLKKTKIAFFLDIGGGWIFAAKIGILIKGFTFKIGYNLDGYFISSDNYRFVFSNAITFDIGYTFN